MGAWGKNKAKLTGAAEKSPTHAAAVAHVIKSDKKHGWSDKIKGKKKAAKFVAKAPAPAKAVQGVIDGTALPDQTTPTPAALALAKSKPELTSQEPYVDPYADKMSSALNRRFDFLRQKTEGAANAESEQVNDALARSLAAHGRSGSGSGQKQISMLNRDLSARKETAIGDIESQRELGQAQLDEQTAARAFTRSERLGGQEFAHGERLGSQDYGTSERLGSQAFQQKEMDRNARFQDRQFRESVNQFSQSMAFESEKFGFDKYVSEFNMEMARKQWNKPTMMEWFGQKHGVDTQTGKDWTS